MTPEPKYKMCKKKEHYLSPENSRINSEGFKTCRACDNRRSEEYRKRRRIKRIAEILVKTGICEVLDGDTLERAERLYPYIVIQRDPKDRRGKK